MTEAPRETVPMKPSLLPTTFAVILILSFLTVNSDAGEDTSALLTEVLTGSKNERKQAAARLCNREQSINQLHFSESVSEFLHGVEESIHDQTAARIRNICRIADIHNLTDSIDCFFRICQFESLNLKVLGYAARLYARFTIQEKDGVDRLCRVLDAVLFLNRRYLLDLDFRASHATHWRAIPRERRLTKRFYDPGNTYGSEPGTTC